MSYSIINEDGTVTENVPEEAPLVQPDSVCGKLEQAAQATPEPVQVQEG